MTTPDGVGPLLKACLKLGRITQADLASRAGLTPKHLSQLIRGHAMLTPRVAVAIERETGLDARLLLFADVDRQVHLARATLPRRLRPHCPSERSLMTGHLPSVKAIPRQEYDMTDTLPEPSIGSRVHQTGTKHIWTRLDNGAWSCVCDVNDTVQWDWESVMGDIGSAPYVIEAAVPDLNAHLEAS